ncbi:MAG: trypsin-like peptidase domain-containing protein [Thiotrichales bacterium]
MVFRSVLLLVMVSWATGALAMDVCETPRTDVLGSVVRVVGDGVEGSAVVVADGRVITAAHVIDDVADIQINFDGIHRPARVLSIFPDRDVALLAVDTRYARPIALLDRLPYIDETVWAVGYPLGGNQIASSGRFKEEVRGDLHSSASVNHGQSGGALLVCENGRYAVAGMITAFGAVRRGDDLVRLDDYSVSLSVDEIRYFLTSSQLIARR